MLILNGEFFGDDGGAGEDEVVEVVAGRDGEVFPPLPALFSIVFTVTVVPAGMFLVRLSALFAASDRLLLLPAALAKLLL